MTDNMPQVYNFTPDLIIFRLMLTERLTDELQALLEITRLRQYNNE